MVGSASWCDVKKPFAPAGGVGSSVECFAKILPGQPDGGLATSRDETTCKGFCATKECILDNCDGNKVFKKIMNSDGSYRIEVHPEFCKCNVVPLSYTCPGDPPEYVPSDPFCQPGPGVMDPPVVETSLLTYLVSGPIPIALDPQQSSATITITKPGDPATRTTRVHGSVTFYGQPCPGRECDMLVDMYLYPEAFAGDESKRFHYNVLPDEELTKLFIVGGTAQRRRAHFFSDGHGVILQNNLEITASANRIEDGVGVHNESFNVFRSTNPKDINFVVDFRRGGSFKLIGASLSAGDALGKVEGTLTLVGTVGDLPPIAKASPVPTLECSVPGGALVELDGSGSNDPDGDAMIFGWSRGSERIPVDPRSPGGRVTVVAPLGTTEYRLALTSPNLISTYDTTTVTVRDTTAPVLDFAVDPECLWAPNHKLVLYDPSHGIGLKALDACDPTPKVRIIGVTSSQPTLGGGSGSTAPDVIFGTGAFCLRAERAGTGSQGRQYSVTVETTDSSGNKATQTVTVEVPHDQSGAGCKKLDASRIVEDDDPRCTAEAPADWATAAPPPAAIAPAAGQHDLSGCSFATRSSGAWWAALLVVGLLLVSRLQRRRELLIILLGFAAVAGCAKEPLGKCVVGWWRDPLYDGCVCPTQPECQSNDCKAIPVLGFNTDGTYYGGTVSWSAQMGTMSSVGPMTKGTYTVTDTSITFVRGPGDQFTNMVTCDGSSMTVNGTNKVRASAGLATGLAAATVSGLSWKNVAIAP